MQRWIQRALIGWMSLELAVVAEAGAQTAEPEAVGSSGGLISLAQDLTLSVTEDGPAQPWTITLANRGNEPLGLIADPGLLWFDVTLPGRAPQSCRLPEPLRPTAMQRKSVLVLQPGEQYSRRLDPRFFCFAELGQVLLVPKAKVTPNFGWPRELPGTDKSTKGKRRAASAAAAAGRPAEPPFVAWRLNAAEAGAVSKPPPPAPASAEGGAEEGTEPEAPAGARWRLPTEGLKSVQGATLELPDSYVAWVGPSRRDGQRDMELVLIAGADAEDERNATVTFGVINTLDRPQQIFVRRELLEYDVQGPDGFFECPSSDVGSPDFASVATLPPHGAERAVVRLIEICPRRSFARPGLYEVRARLAARWSGQELGLDAFVGKLETARPAFVRVRSGDRSSFARLVVPPAAPGGAAPAPGTPAAPAEAAPAEPAPAEEAPADHPVGPDEPAAPEQAPGHEAPPVE